MKTSHIFGKEKSTNLIRGPITYKTAFTISILIHGLLFVLMILLFSPIEIPHSYERPLIIGFDFAPSKEDQQESYNTEEEHVNQIAHSLNLIKSGSHSKSSNNRVEERILQSSQSNEIVDSSIEPYNPNDISEQPEEPNFTQPIWASLFTPPSLKIPRMDIAEPKLLPSKKTMTEKQKETLFKKINKLAGNLHKMEWSDSMLVLEDKNQIYAVRIHHKPAKTHTELDEVIFEVTTHENGKTLSTELRMRRLAFSNFAQLVDYWDPNVAVHNDEFEGLFHTNSTFAISRSRGIGPKFHGKVTTAAYEVKKRGPVPIIDEESIFIGGIEMGVKGIRLPKVFTPLSGDAKIDSSRIHYLTEDTWVTFHRNGLYTWKTLSSSRFEQRKRIPQSSFFIVGDKGADIHVKGIIKGKVLVYSQSNIIIDDDLLYARHPEIVFGADDYLGLVSEKDVEIAHPAVTGPGDLHIYAAIYAKRRFRIPQSRGNGEATLHIYGSLSAGSLSATEPRYATRIRFDKRLETNRPPNFPQTERYELIDWEKEWKVKDY